MTIRLTIACLAAFLFTTTTALATERGEVKRAIRIPMTKIYLGFNPKVKLDNVTVLGLNAHAHGKNSKAFGITARASALAGGIISAKSYDGNAYSLLFANATRGRAGALGLADGERSAVALLGAVSPKGWTAAGIMTIGETWAVSPLFAQALSGPAVAGIVASGSGFTAGTIAMPARGPAIGSLIIKEGGPKVGFSR